MFTVLEGLTCHHQFFSPSLCHCPPRFVINRTGGRILGPFIDLDQGAHESEN